MAVMVKRQEYLDRILQFKDHDVIKVITGMRRSGKSILLQQLRDELITQGISPDMIRFIDMDSLSNRRFYDGLVLYDDIMSSFKGERIYIMIDEVQYISDWHRVVESLRNDIDCDIYITGSNAYILSSDLSTLLTGRTIEFLILPLSLKELYQLGVGSGPDDILMRYIRQGGLPFIRPEFTEEMIFNRIQEIKADIILKDICNRKERIDSNKVRTVIDYLYSEIGNMVSVDNIASALDISTSTASEYLNLVIDSMMFMRAERYDIRGKQVLRSSPKYYCTDLGMRSTQPISKDRDIGRILENAVFLELVRRGGRVYVGKDEEREVDFIVQKNGRTEYYQVCYSISDPATREREYAPFKRLTDRGERYLIVADRMPRIENEYAIQMGITEFLMGPEGMPSRIDSDRRDALMELDRRLKAYIAVCRECFHMEVTYDNFTELSDNEQRSFFDLQAAFRDPMLMDDVDLKRWLQEITMAGVRIHDALIRCANANSNEVIYRPVHNGEMELLTRISSDVAELIRRS